MISFQYLEPATVDEAIDALTEHGDDAKVIAGGTALVNLMKQRLVQPEYVIGLRRIPGFDAIHRNGDLRIGALATHRSVETSPLAQTYAPVLVEALHQVASVKIRNIATLGGSLAHADPNQDPPPALIVLGARVRVRSASGDREVPVDQFFTGYYETVLEPNEILMEIIIPEQPAGSAAAFLNFLPQTQDDYATVSAAARLTVRNGRVEEARVAAGSAGQTPIRLSAVEDALRGKAVEPALFRDAAVLTREAVDPTTDFRGSAAYKRDMAVVFVRRALELAANRAQGATT